MKKIVIVASLILIIAQYGYAAGTGGCRVKEKSRTTTEAGTSVKPDTIFQKLGDFMTGNYEVRGEPIKKTGVFQPVADEIQRTKPAAVR